MISPALHLNFPGMYHVPRSKMQSAGNMYTGASERRVSLQSFDLAFVSAGAKMRAGSFCRLNHALCCMTDQRAPNPRIR